MVTKKEDGVYVVKHPIPPHYYRGVSGSHSIAYWVNDPHKAKKYLEQRELREGSHLTWERIGARIPIDEEE